MVQDYIDIDKIDIEALHEEITQIINIPIEESKYSNYKPGIPELDAQDINILIKVIKDNVPEKDDNVRYIKGYREYFIDGKWLISITSLINKTSNTEYLDKWKEKVGDRHVEITEEAARIGELVHYQTLETMKRELPNTGEFDLWQELPEFLLKDEIMIPERIQEYQEYLNQAALLTREFLEVYHDKIKMVSIERRVSNAQFGYAGRFDFQFYLFDAHADRWIPCLGDIKTSDRVHDSVKTQLTAYNLSDDLRGWGERLYELRIHPYPDNEWGYGWEFVLLDHDREGVENCVFTFAEMEKQELDIKNESDPELKDYEE